MGSERDEKLTAEELDQSLLRNTRLLQDRLADLDAQLEKMCVLYDESRARFLMTEAELWRISAKTGEPVFPGSWENVNLPKTGISLTKMGIDVERPSWDEIWMGMAHELARRSIDPRTKVGCLIVSGDNTQVLAVGYNGNYRGGPNTVESLEPGKSGTIHAETNALIKCDYNNPKTKVIYVTSSPCAQCAKLIINGGIDEVIYDLEYRDPAGLNILREAGVKLRRYARIDG